jgi:putative FmdB family regulatory protein
MPVYEYRCPACGREEERLLPRDAAAPACPGCGAVLRKRFSRVAVRYQGWGFKATDSLVRDPRGKDFAALRERAEQISDGER